MLTLYGIPNCDTVKKARAWLTEQGWQHTFHDFKKQGVPADKLAHWVQVLGWEALVNRQGTTWRKLDDATKAAVVDSASAQSLMLSHASVIKRPVLERDGQCVCVGFEPLKAVLGALAPRQ